MNEEFFSSNRALWDEMTRIHVPSAFYDVAGFKAGKTSLKQVELEEVGEVAGKSLLHLQCHFGLDTLSWARLGAAATGVDFSDAAIMEARRLSDETGVSASFICANVYALPRALAGKFDIVFTSYGVLCWLPDLTRWGEVVAHFLKRGGTFYIVEFHPFAYMFDDEGKALKYPYFNAPEPLKIQGTGDYADPAADLPHVSYEWPHPLSEVINALIGAGLRLEYVHEFPFTSYPVGPSFTHAGAGQAGGPAQPPLMFSIRATC